MNPRSALAGLGVLAILTVSSPVPRPAHAAGLGPLPASYGGVLPCADCVGLRHQLSLFPGGGFILALSFFRDGRDETFYEMGWYELSADSSELSLATHDPQGTRFAVQADGSLRLLDRDGQRIDSSLSHELRREASPLPLEPRLMLRGSYSYLADAGVFTDCRSGMRFPVAPGEGAHQLEKAFLEEKAFRKANAKTGALPPKQGRDRKGDGASWTAAEGVPAGDSEMPPLVVTLLGRIAVRPPAGIEGNRPTLVVEHFLEAYPNETCGARGVTNALESTRWVLTRLGSDPVRLGPQQREIHLSLDAKAGRVAGYSGCNRFTGTYTMDSSDAGRLTFDPVAGTRMACVGPDHESRLYHALELTRSFTITGAHLELLDAAGDVLARFEARNL